MLENSWILEIYENKLGYLQLLQKYYKAITNIYKSITKVTKLVYPKSALTQNI